MNKIHTHYENLKVSRNAPDEVIRAAYKVLAQKYHPDRNHGDLDAARIMTVVNTSYRVLSDPDERWNHDRWIEEQELMAAQTDAPKQAASEPPPPPPEHERPAPTAPAHVQTPEMARRYAGFWKRLVAMILDNLILIAVFLFLIFVFNGFMDFKDSDTLEGWVSLVSIPLFWLYFAFMESSVKQATFGKMALGIKVVDLQGNRISFWRASGRYFAKIVSYVILLIGYLMAAFTQRKQALHDMMAGCLVVNKAAEPIELQQTGSASRMSTGAKLALVVGLLPIPIIGIIEAIGLSAYQDYVVRAKATAMQHDAEPSQENKDQETDFQKLLHRAEQGNVGAQLALGLMYARGEGVPQDDTEAVRWYRKAADQGDANAQFNLGVLYFKGQGVPENDAEAVNWFRKAAEQGNANAQTFLGAMYYQGQGVPQNDAEAVNWFRKAAEQGNANAQTFLGGMYYQGRGVPQDYTEALKWFRKAAEQGDASAQNNLGMMYRQGRGVPQNDAEAVKWYRKAAEQGDADAQARLGSMYTLGRGVPQDDTEAAN